MMEERRNLLQKMENDVKKKGFSRMVESYHGKGEELQFHVDKMKEILFATQNSQSVDYNL